MAMNRVRYQAGLPMFEFFENYGTPELSAPNQI
jgi:hypothetical protein